MRSKLLQHIIYHLQSLAAHGDLTIDKYITGTLTNIHYIFWKTNAGSPLNDTLKRLWRRKTVCHVFFNFVKIHQVIARSSKPHISKEINKKIYILHITAVTLLFSLSRMFVLKVLKL